jgi:HlyD family secretion protein
MGDIRVHAVKTMRKWIVLAIIALLITVPVAIKLARSGEAKQVDIEPVSLHVLSPSILASGTLTYESEVKLVSEIIGRVQEVHVKEGDFVKQGDLLLRLDPATWLAEIAQLEAALRQSRLNIERQRVTLETQEAKWKRYQSLRSQGIVDANTYEEIASARQLAQVELKTSREALKQTEAQLEQARERLAKTVFRAPISGKVTAVFIEVGETAVPSATSIAGSDLMIVADTKTMYAEVNVDETDVARVGVGQEAKIVPAAFPDRAWIGTVEQVAISPRQNAGQSKSYPVKIRLGDKADMRFHPGMSCRAEISTRNTDAAKTLAVPVQAVRYEETENKEERAKASVFVANAGKAQQREVETGLADDSHIEIRSGLKQGEEIVTGPAKTLRFLKDGDRVAASEKSPASPAVAANP